MNDYYSYKAVTARAANVVFFGHPGHPSLERFALSFQFTMNGRARMSLGVQVMAISENRILYRHTYICQGAHEMEERFDLPF